MKRLVPLTFLLAGCGAGEEPVPDSRPVAPEVAAAARKREIDAPREWAARRGANLQTGTSRSVADED